MKRRDFFGVAASGCLFPAKSVQAKSSDEPMLRGMTDEQMARLVEACYRSIHAPRGRGIRVNLTGPELRPYFLYAQTIWKVEGTAIHVKCNRKTFGRTPCSCRVLDTTCLDDIQFIDRSGILREYRRVLTEYGAGWFTLAGSVTDQDTLLFQGKTGWAYSWRAVVRECGVL